MLGWKEVSEMSGALERAPPSTEEVASIARCGGKPRHVSMDGGATVYDLHNPKQLAEFARLYGHIFRAESMKGTT